MSGNDTNSTTTASSSPGVSKDPFVFVYSTYIPLICLICFENAVVILAIFIYDTRRKGRIVLVGSLAFVDFVTGAISVPFAMRGFLSRQSMTDISSEECQIMYGPLMITGLASFLHIFVLTIDCFTAVILPFKYRTGMSSTKIYLAILGIWAISILFGMIPYCWKLEKEDFHDCYQLNSVGLTIQMLISGNICFVIFIVITILYIRIAKEALTHRPRRNINQTIPRQPKKYEDFKAVRTTSLILGAFLFCWTPVILKFILLGFDVIDIDEQAWFTWFGEVLVISNSALNPIIYCYSSKDVYKRCKSLLKFTSNINRSAGTSRSWDTPL
ncbi:G-protein coupled receptor 12-like [Anneissia japonica]|uniref:G-protein coupled receptor 12-like n=1 Tax=Anneissia japonica TaxID=1529436 RepID=UPI0014258BAE|nr:G-protein coupled receptor 12-like [Anneissia japonica]